MLLYPAVLIFSFVLGAQLPPPFPTLQDAHFDAKELCLINIVTMQDLEQEISTISQMVSATMMWYLQTKGKYSAMDSLELSDNHQGTRTAAFWVSVRHRLDVISAEGLSMEAVYCLYYIMAFELLQYDSPVIRRGQIIRFTKKRINFIENLDLKKIQSPAAFLKNHVANLLKEMKEPHSYDSQFTKEAKFRNRFYFKAIKILHYATLLYPMDSIDVSKVELHLACHALTTSTLDIRKPFDEFFVPYCKTLKSLHSILVKGKLDIPDHDHQLASLLFRTLSYGWSTHMDHTLSLEIQKTYLHPFFTSNHHKSDLARLKAKEMIAEEEKLGKRKGIRVLKEEARERKVMESASEDEEIPAQESTPEINLQQWTFSDLTEPLAFTIKVILAQHYRLNFLLPIWDSLDGNTGEEGSDFSWDAFVRDPQVHQKAEELFEIKPDDLLRMSIVVTERNELVHRRPYPRVIYLKSRWESLFGTLAGAAMEVANYAQIKVLEEESDLIDNIQPSLRTAFAETTYTLLSLTLACEQLNYHTAIRVQCDKLQEYRNGYAHPRLDKFQRLLPQLTKLSLN